MKRPRRHSTVPVSHPPRRKEQTPRPVSTPRPHREKTPPPPARPFPPRPPRAAVAAIIDDSDGSLVDVLDSLLNQGVMLNADIVLALANVDLVYLRLSALLCAADRVLPPRR
jgi:hypothetical protein